MSTSTTKNLEQIVGFDSLTQKVRGIADTPQFKLLVRSLHTKASRFYEKNTSPEAPELVMDEAKARELADELFDVAATHIAVNYLKLKPEAIAKLKGEKDPASGKPQWAAFIKEHLGVNADDIYEELKTRGAVKPQEIDALINPIYQAHARAFTTKAATTYIDSIEKATSALEYLRELKKVQPKTLEGLNIPKAVKSTDEATRLYVSAIQAISRDYKPNVAAAYKPAA